MTFKQIVHAICKEGIIHIFVKFIENAYFACAHVICFNIFITINNFIHESHSLYGFVTVNIFLPTVSTNVQTQNNVAILVHMKMSVYK